MKGRAIVYALALAGSIASTIAQTVAIPDSGLNTAIRDALGNPSGLLTVQDLLTLTNLDANGLALLNQLHGGTAGEQMVEAMKGICPDFATMTIEWAMAGIMARPGLDLLTREYVVIASCATLGHAVPQLRAHIASALKLGATKQQVVEVILQTLFYAGGAVVANALNVANELFKGRPCSEQPANSEHESA
jgi:4-carboxymuconolactone decarboxylase